MNNKKLGTEHERDMVRRLTKKGYWVHFMAPDERGAQPFDIIAVKNQKAYAIECKTLSKERRFFPFSRLEDNQIMAFEKWLACGNGSPIISIKWGDSHIVNVLYTELKSKGKIDVKERAGE